MKNGQIIIVLLIVLFLPLQGQRRKKIVSRTPTQTVPAIPNIVQQPIPTAPDFVQPVQESTDELQAPLSYAPTSRLGKPDPIQTTIPPMPTPPPIAVPSPTPTPITPIQQTPPKPMPPVILPAIPLAPLPTIPKPVKTISPFKHDKPATPMPTPPEPDLAYSIPEGKIAKASGNKEKSKLASTDKFPPTDENNIYLNFENSDLKSFVNYIAEIKNINLIPDPKIAGVKIALTIRKPLNVEGAWNIFLTVLEMAGFSIIKVGAVYKIIPKAAKLTEPLPTFINVPADTLPDSDLTIRFVTFLNNIPIEQARPLLQSMLSQPSQIIDYQSANGFVITDKSYNIKSAMKVIQELDRSDVKQSVTVMKLKRANAEDVKQLFDSLIARPQAGNPLARLLGRKPEDTTEYFPSNTKIIAEPRTNSLILLGEQKSIKRIEDFIIKNVDTELKGVRSPIHIYELEHTDVDQVKNILEALVQSNSDSPAAKYGGIRGGVKYFKQMKFDMDKTNNRLIVSSTDTQDWKLLKQTIKDLDKPQPQVAIETMIVAVDFNSVKELGAQIRNKKHGTIGKHIDFQAANLTNIIPERTKDAEAKVLSLLGNLLPEITGGLGSTILSFGNAAAQNIWSVVKILQSKTNTTVLSEPFIVTTNMKKAKIVIGTKKRLAYQKIIADSSTDAQLGYKNADANLSLEVMPQINLDGVIKLNVAINISDFLIQEKGAIAPDTTTKRLETEASVANGQILVLGGFVKTKIIEEIRKTPFLNRIPIFGWFFKHKKRDIAKEYIFIFMSPTIIKPRKSPGTNLYTKMKLHRATSDVDESVNVKHNNDPIHNWFFNPEGETYSHKIVDFANARYQPTSVDIENDPYYRAKTKRAELLEVDDNDEELLEQKTPDLEKTIKVEKEISKIITAKIKSKPAIPTPKVIVHKPPVTEIETPKTIETVKEKPIVITKKESIQEKPIESLDVRQTRRERLKQAFTTQNKQPSYTPQPRDKKSIRTAKRQKLKDMLATPKIQVAHAPVFADKATPDTPEINNRERLKDFLATSPNTKEQAIAPTNRREAFKDFIASNEPVEISSETAS